MAPPHPLVYSESKGVACPHRLMVDIGPNQFDHDAFQNNIMRVMAPYGEWGVDYVIFLQINVFYAYFRSKATAMRFKLAWTPRSIFGDVLGP